MMDLQKTYRIIDANLNRAKEGLRVVEEISRFVLDDAILSKKLKELRHILTRVATDFFCTSWLLSARKADEDIGRVDFDRTGRENYLSLIKANMSRAQEAVRVLEEFSKILSSQTSSKAGDNILAFQRFKEIRFNLYDIEKEIHQRVVEQEDLSDS